MRCDGVGVTPRALEFKEWDSWEKQGMYVLLACVIMCIYCILVYAYITAHYCTCTVHLHQINKSIRRYVYQHI